MNFLEKSDCLKDNSPLKEFHEALKETKTAMNYVDRKFAQQADWQTGDFIMYRGEDYAGFLNRKLDTMVAWQLSWLGSDYFHSA